MYSEFFLHSHLVCLTLATVFSWFAGFFRVRQPKAGPTKPDNTQTGLIEIRQVDIVFLLHLRFSKGAIQLRRQLAS